MLRRPTEPDVLILLPPSEGKTAPERGPAVDLSALSFADLSPIRARLMSALVTLCRRSPAEAAEALGLGPTQSGEVARNAALRTASCAPAIEIYSGVLYDALDAATLTAASRRRLASRVVVASALFGLLRPGDLIPAYRLSGDSRLPGQPSLREVWRAPVSTVLTATTGAGMVLDLRSSTYADLAPMPMSEHAVQGRITQERGGRRVAVSHHNKAMKGQVVRALVECTRTPRTARDLLDVCRAAGFDADLEPARHGGWTLDVLMS